MKRQSSESSGDLRKRAEERLKSGQAQSGELSSEEVQEIIYDLRVHQIELEMQNEELRNAQAQIEESRARYSDLYDFAPIGYLTLDKRGWIVEANLTGARQLGIERGRLVNTPFLGYIAAQDRQTFLSFLGLLFETQKQRSCEIRLVPKAGDAFFALLDGIFVQGTDNEFCRVSISDISERKRAEEALSKAYDELELRVRERTAELALVNTELKEHAARLEQLNRELEEFIWIASHDLQEPLRKIQAFGSRLIRIRDVLTEENREDLLRIIHSANRMASLIKALMSYSDITGGKDPPEFTDLSAVVRETVNDLEIAVREAGGRIEVSELPSVRVDRVRMRQLFQNLIGNSIKYAKENEKPVVRITGQVVDGTCRIYVEDNGIGFEEHYLDRIFVPFQRLHGPNSPYEGTGMGLAICRKVAEMHGGTLTAGSTPGRGATFILSLPLKQGKETEHNGKA